MYTIVDARRLQSYTRKKYTKNLKRFTGIDDDYIGFTRIKASLVA
jgi:hypothetical protein